MLTIRLQRTGRKNSPDFRIVLAEKHRAASKKVVEVFGQYNPRTKNFYLSNKEGLLARIKKNIEVSPTVHNLLIEKKIIEGQKVKAWRPKRKEAEETKDEPAKVEGSTDTKASADAEKQEVAPKIGGEEKGTAKPEPKSEEKKEEEKSEATQVVNNK